MLEALAKKYGTDKLQNGYIPRYEHHIGSIRDNIKSVLEIGVFGGASLRMWRDYFPNAIIVGVDINPACVFTEDRIIVEHGDISSEACIKKLYKHESFDIIIDDAGHFTSHQEYALKHLWPLLNVGGWYVIEDLETQIRGGKWVHGGYTNIAGYTTLDVLYKKVTALNHQKCDYDTLCFYHSLCFIKKSQ